MNELMKRRSKVYTVQGTEFKFRSIIDYTAELKPMGYYQPNLYSYNTR